MNDEYKIPDILEAVDTLLNNKLRVVTSGGGFFGYQIHTIDISNSIDSGNIFYDQFNYLYEFHILV